MTLISTPALLLCLLLLYLHGSGRVPKAVVTGALVGLPLFAVLALVSATVELASLEPSRASLSDWARVGLHAVGAATAVWVLVHTVRFLRRGLNRLF